MKAMLLSAGLGLRMRPLTHRVPKPAIPVLGRPIAVEILNKMKCHGVDEVVINLHHLPEEVVRIVGEGEPAGLPDVRYSREETILGTGGGLRRAAGMLRGDGPILVHNCDFLSDIDLQAVVAEHRASGNLATLVLAEARPGYSVVHVDRAGTVLSIADRPPVSPDRIEASALFTGCHVIDEALLDRIPVGRPSCIVADVYRELIEEGRLGSYLHHGFWWEFGTPENYLDGSLNLVDLPLEKRLAITTHDGVRKINGGVAAMGAGAVLQPGARIEGRAAVGLACLVGRNSEIRDSVIMPEAWIGPGSRLERVIVGPGVEIPAVSFFRNALICRRTGSGRDSAPGVRRDGDLLVYDFASERLPTA
jgi:NDP-sugar pyrophosphorylase family protein